MQESTRHSHCRHALHPYIEKSGSVAVGAAACDDVWR